MPKLIKDGEIVEDQRWAQVDAGLEQAQADRIATLDQWLALEDKAGSAVQLEPGEDPAELLPHLRQIDLVTINFPVFTDGRGFSYARALREQGFQGEIRAVGAFIRDQLHYLRRCGFNAFQLADGSSLEDALDNLQVFDESYQAAIDESLPLFRRRA